MTTSCPEPLALDASLHLLADHLADALASGELDPSLLHVAGVDRGGFDLGTRPLAGCHPADLLLGFTAPGHWHAVGIAARGWARRGVGTGSPTERTRVEVVTIVSRSGELAHHVRADGASLSGSVEAVPSGPQVDLLLRSLGLATPPPPCPAAAWWAITWLAELAAPGGPPVTGLADALDVHPAFRLLSRGAVTVDADTVDVLAAFSRVCDWSRLRRLVADGAFEAPGLSAADAAWLDEGSFARFLLAAAPGLAEVRRAALGALHPVVAHDVDDLLEALGIPDRCWPDVDDAE